VVEQLDRADFDDAVAFGGFKAGGFGIKDDFTHGQGPAAMAASTSFTAWRAASRLVVG
jgi:hypothetical protein